MSKAEEICRWYQTGKNDRQNFDEVAQEIIDYIDPYHADVTSERAPGEKKNQLIFDSSARYGGHVFSQFVQGSIFNPGTKWYSMRHRDESLNSIQRVADWLQATRDQMLNAMKDSLYGPGGQCINSWAFFGTGALLIEEVPKAREGLKRIRYTSLPFGQYVMFEGDDGKIDKIIRSIKLPAYQVVSRFGDKVSDDTRRIADKTPEKKIEVLHSIMPREMQKFMGGKTRNIQTEDDMPFESVWIEKEKKNLLKEGGYRKFPVAVARYDLISGEVYGRGLAELALPDAKSLNQADHKALLKWDRELDPPTLTRRNSVIGGILNKRAGGNTMTSVDPRNAVVPLFENSNWVAHDNMAARKEQAILRIFHVNEILNLLAREKPEMTAFEVNARLTLLQQIIGPVFGLLEEEFLSVIIDLTLDIMAHNRMIDDPPDEIADNLGYNVVYEGPLARAQRNAEILAIQQTFADLTGVLPIYPEVKVDVDGHKAFRLLCEIRGTQGILNSEQDALEAENKMIEQQNAQTALQVAGGTAEALGKAAPALQVMREGAASGRSAA